MDIVIRPGALTNASSPEHRNKGILLDVTRADRQAQVHLRDGSATSDGTAAQASEARSRQRYARPGHVSFHERSFKLTTLAVENFGRLGEEGYEFIDELATHTAGGRDGGSLALEQVFKERLLQVISVATLVAISRNSSAVQAGTTRTTRGGGKNKISLTGIDTDDLGMQCRRAVERVFFSKMALSFKQAS